jgi:hypothetical protein
MGDLTAVNSAATYSKKFPRGCGPLEFIQPVFTQLQYCHDFFDVFAELDTSVGK